MAVLTLYFVIVPPIIGKGMENIIAKKDRSSWAELYIWGNLVLWAIFQVISVVLGIFKVRFTVISLLFGGIILFLVSTVLWKFHKDIKITWKKRGKLYWQEWAVIFLIMCQTCISVFCTTYIGADDATYIAISLDAVDKDFISVYAPYTGQPGGVSLKILLTSWNYYISFLSKLSGIHVAAVAHTFLPAFMIPMAYMVYWLIARVLFHNDRNRQAAFLLWLNILIMFGAYSWYTLTLRLDICIWHGKAVMAAIVLPFLFYYLFHTEKYGKKELLHLLLIMTAMCAMSLMGVGLSIVMVLVVFIIRCRKEHIKSLLPLLGAAAVISLIAVFYIFKLSYVNSFTYDAVKKLFPNATGVCFGANSLYWNGSRIQWIYYLCLLYLWINRQKNDTNRFLSRYVVWLYILIFNPVFYYVAYVFLEGANVYVRLYYTLFPELYMAYILTVLIFALNNRKIRVFCTLLCSVMIAVSGTAVQKLAAFSKSDNLFKLPKETVEICDIINQDSEDIPRVIVFEGGDIDRSQLVYLRQYSSRIQMPYGRGGYSYKGKSIFGLIDNSEISPYEMVGLMEETNCQYMILKYNQDSMMELEALGCRLTAITENYMIFSTNGNITK